MPKIFRLKTEYSPTGDQPQAIEKLAKGVKADLKNQVLLGVTGSGKTFTMASLIEKLQMPALIISHNKTLAGQLYQEMRDFFPENGVSYYVSYYDYYQPEAYMPATDTYIEKEAQINDMIDKLRLRTTTNILTRKDAIVVASVSCIYNIGDPGTHSRFVVELKKGDEADQLSMSRRFAALQYQRSEFEFGRGTFRIRGSHVDIYPSYEDFAVRISIGPDNLIKKFIPIDPLTGSPLADEPERDSFVLYPAKQFLTDRSVFEKAEENIRKDLQTESEILKKMGKELEARRLVQRVTYDLEMIKEVGYVSGIENYSRYFDGRGIGAKPFSLLDYFQKAYGDDYLVFIDESHMSVPQIRGMYNGDRARKETLISFGFRLKSAFDNRPMRFEEFYSMPKKIIYVSATPDQWEIDQAKADSQSNKKSPHSGVVEQVIRPTGILDPEVEVRPIKNEIEDLISEIEIRADRGEKVLVTTLTKKTAEDLSRHLKEKNMRAAYLHSDIDTLERSDILDNLRKGEFDALIGVNLLREGLDLPEVTLVAILDADKEGFLRSRTSLIQTMGRAARNTGGRVILYADKMTESMKYAIGENNRRREIQDEYNKKHGISPKTIIKPIRGKIVEREAGPKPYEKKAALYEEEVLSQIDDKALTPYDKKKLLKRLELEMRRAAEDMNFELAIMLRDKIRELKQ
jgi:excinuclease ABC subunit B